MTSGEDFFEEMKEQSIVKIEIVRKYFIAWANVILPSIESMDGRLGYIDLFSGRGIYEDGTKSTPIIVIEEAINHPRLGERLQKRLVTLFNDANPTFATELQFAIDKIPGIEQLRNKPIVMNDLVGDKAVKKFKEINFIPSLFFIDPWGYKGISLSLLESILKDWGCDCILFFNYNRINMGLNNPAFKDNINAIFGKERAAKLREIVIKLNPIERELTIIEELALAINELGFPYILPFCFKGIKGKKTSHYLVFISKNETGYGIMKDIMAKYSSEMYQGVPSFEYCPATKKHKFLFSFKTPLNELSKMLQKEFKGKSLTMIEIFKRHNIGKPFIKRNYKEVLYKMEEDGLIKVDPPLYARKKGTFKDNALVTFPEK
ncbi:MAG: three-Cys-motif partner protein TcmP [Desulfobaccales bacterium]